MAIPKWTPSTIYLPGALVEANTFAPIVLPSIPNSGFEDGDTGWTKGTGWDIDEDEAFQGDWSAVFTGDGSNPTAEIANSTFIACQPGLVVNVRAKMADFADSGGGGKLRLKWYEDDDLGTFIKDTTGELFEAIAGSEWRDITMGAVAPATANFVSVAFVAEASAGIIRVDNFTWDLFTSGAASGLVFKAIQTTAGLSGATEPTWPTLVGDDVVDNQVTWEAIYAVTVTWEASPLLKSGATEPTWPTVAGALVIDGNIAWECERLSIDDENCPHTREVAIMASKIFAGDEDITRFSATLNPRDWTSIQDAGFLPTGLQQRGQVGVTALGNYRGNLAVWSKGNVQIWQVDPDPAAMALLDSMDGVGAFNHKSVQQVSNDLFFLAALGVRTVGVAVASTNLATGDAGLPIDPLVQEDMVQSVDPMATYYPAAGQYWLWFPPYTESGPEEPPPEEVPDEELYLTSWTYPVYTSDSMTVTFEIGDGQTVHKTIEEMDIGFAVLGGSLDEVHLYYTMPEPDEIDVSFAVLGGVLDTVHLYYSMETESTDVEFAVLSGELIVVSSLIEYEHPVPEEMDVSFAVLSGTLTTV